MGQLVEKIGEGADIITLHNAVSAFTTPTVANTGVDVSRWQTFGAGPSATQLEFSASAACQLAGPLGVYCTMSDGTVIYEGLVGDGANIDIPNAVVSIGIRANIGGAVKLQIAPPATDTNLTGSTCTPTNGATVTVKARPIRTVMA